MKSYIDIKNSLDQISAFDSVEPLRYFRFQSKPPDRITKQFQQISQWGNHDTFLIKHAFSNQSPSLSFPRLIEDPKRLMKHTSQQMKQSSQKQLSFQQSIPELMVENHKKVRNLNTSMENVTRKTRLHQVQMQGYSVAEQLLKRIQNTRKKSVQRVLLRNQNKIELDPLHHFTKFNEQIPRKSMYNRAFRKPNKQFKNFRNLFQKQMTQHIKEKEISPVKTATFFHK